MEAQLNNNDAMTGGIPDCVGREGIVSIPPSPAGDRRSRQHTSDHAEAFQRLAVIVDSSNDAIFSKTLEGTITDWNLGAQKIYGYAAGEIIGRPVSLLVPPDRVDELAEIMRRIRSGERVEHPDTIRVTKDGRRIHITLTVSPIRDSRGIVIGASAVAHDITARKRAEQSIRESEERFRTMADTAPVMIWLSEPDRLWSYFNKRWLEFTGTTMDCELGYGWTRRVHPEDLAACLSTYETAFERREPFEMEHRLRRRDGEYRWLLQTGVPRFSPDATFVGYIGSCIDITEHKIAEDFLKTRVEEHASRLAETNARLREEIAQRKTAERLKADEKHVLELIATCASIEPALEAMCRMMEQQCPGARCAIRILGDIEAIPIDQSSADTKGCVSHPAPPRLIGSPAGGSGFPAESHNRVMIQNVDRDASWAAYREAAAAHGVRACWFEPIIGVNGEVLGTLGVYYVQARPPTESELELGESAARLAGIALEHQRMEERSRKQLAQLSHVTRLATMGEMASGLAHELNQPLCAIVNFVEACLGIMDSDSDSSEKLRGIMVDVARQAERAGKVIHRLREFVRRREPTRTPIDVNYLVREVVELMKSEISRDGVRTHLELSKRVPPVLADEIQIEQVILNLVRNALQAMQGIDPSNRDLVIKTARRGQHVEVTLRDTGCGIPTEVIEHVFEPFFSTKSNGMGMGLSISRSILEVHDGRLWVSANPDCGTTFRFTLPIAKRRS